MSLEITAWEEHNDTTDKHRYRVQVRAKKLGDIRPMFKTGWEVVGEGFSPRNKEHILIFSREFDNRKQWEAFAKSLDVIVKEIKKSGKERVFNVRKAKKAQKGG
ncbi:MAG: hypothetical protein CMB95_06895 [Flavobacteriaceae bacterium]|nr:hypothetical protein [Flavobacteriaceae bacterium]|tara:strand:- start:6456 stop:6767 length:312 start_codon:yes stop_codon:yes gene_type:complete